MSKADEMHNKIMQVIMCELRTENCTYADVFGALVVSKAFFEVEYSAKMAATWREALKAEEFPNVELSGRADHFATENPAVARSAAPQGYTPE